MVNHYKGGTKMARKVKIESINDKVFNTINYLLLTTIIMIILYPLIFTLSASFSDAKMVTTGKLTLLPVGFNVDAYREVFKSKDILTGYRNTLIIAALGTLVNMIMTVCGAYPLSRKDFYGRNVFMMIFAFTMFFSGGIITLFLVVQKVGLMNSWAALILPGAVSTYNLIIMRTYFETSVPYELQEAAY